MKIVKTNTKIYDKRVDGFLYPSYIVDEKSGTRKRYLVALRKTEYAYKKPYRQDVPSFDNLLKSKEPFTLV